MGILITSPESFAQSSGLINFAFLGSLYESLIDETFVGIGRKITLHMTPQIQADPVSWGNTSTAYNPFFGQAVIPPDSTKIPGVRINTRDIEFTAHIRVGPKDLDDNSGIGRLLANEAQTTTVIESHQYIAECLSATIDGLKYILKEGPRTIGFASKLYVMTKWKRTSEREATDTASNT